MARTVTQGEVWWARLDPAQGSEQAKTRPVLIVSVDQINRAPAGLSIVCPITTTPRDAGVRIELPRDEGVRVGYVEPYQLRTISQERLVGLLGEATPDVRSDVAARIALFTRSAASE
ncbi:MAG: type II toxin-antitoxin system PemK/MazF family toxin [Thermoleophilaceae bacterium]|nr:type II toxin-antitoxin system PemK/MazF family toxin [Thermoleophilaceae bacterium]